MADAACSKYLRTLYHTKLILKTLSEANKFKTRKSSKSRPSCRAKSKAELGKCTRLTYHCYNILQFKNILRDIVSGKENRNLW